MVLLTTTRHKSIQFILQCLTIHLLLQLDALSRVPVTIKLQHWIGEVLTTLITELLEELIGDQGHQIFSIEFLLPDQHPSMFLIIYNQMNHYLFRKIKFPNLFNNNLIQVLPTLMILSINLVMLQHIHVLLIIIREHLFPLLRFEWSKHKFLHVLQKTLPLQLRLSIRLKRLFFVISWKLLLRFIIQLLSAFSWRLLLPLLIVCWLNPSLSV